MPVPPPTPNDELFEPYQWNLRKIDVAAAWNYTTGSTSVIIAILDTGVSPTHPDLAGKLVPGYDFVNNDPSPDDDHGNGTHVAGIVAAETNNRIGIAGIAWQARIMPVKVLDNTARGDTARAAEGVIWAVDRGARIINLGLTGPTPAPELQEAIDYARQRGVLVVAPVGNSGTAEPSYPAAIPGVVAVAATDRTDRRLATSSTGDYISVAAPGEEIPSTFSGPGGPESYAVAGTTAQAAAHVTGVAALLLSLNPALTPDELQQLLETTADDVGTPGRDPETGFGRINAGRAVRQAAPWNFLARGAGSYAGEAAPGQTLYFPLIMKDANGWHTSFTIQNTTQAPASLNVAFYSEVGTLVYGFATILPPAGAETYEPAGLPRFPIGFVGGAVVRSDVPIAGTVNEDRPGRDRLTYEGFTSGSRTVWVPLLMRESGGWSTGLQIQNLGNGQTTARVSFVSRGEIAPLTAATVSLAPFASRTFYQPSDSQIPPGWVGSAFVESVDGQPLAAIVNQVHAEGLGMSYVGIGRPASLIYAPLLFKNNAGWNTGLQVQNASSAESVLSVMYTRANGPEGPWSQESAVRPGGAVTLYQPSNLELPDSFVGAAVVRSNAGQPLAGIVNEIRYGSGMAMAYNTVSGGAESVYVPLLYRAHAGWTSGLQVQNAGNTRTVTTVRFFRQDGAAAASIQSPIEPGGSKTFYLPGIVGIPPNFVGSAVVNSSDGQVLAVTANHVRD